jgi:hypothetical protein
VRGEEAKFYTCDPPVDPGPVYRCLDEAVHGMRKFWLISAAAQSGIFDLCMDGSTIRSLAEHTGGDEVLLSHICHALCREGLLREQEGQFFTTRHSAVYLRSGSPYSQVRYIGRLARTGRDLWMSLPEIMKNGPVLYDREDYYRDQSLPAMAETSLSGRLQETVRAISGLPGFIDAKKMLDLGGGHGLYAIALTRQNPRMEAWVFDLLEVIPLTEEYVRQYRAPRVHTIPGNFFTDPIGEGYDIILSSSNPSGKSVEFLEKIAGALTPWGYFVNVQSDGQKPHDPLQELEWYLWSFENVPKGKGEFTKERPFMTDEYRNEMERLGFQTVSDTRIRDPYHEGTSVRMVISRKK